MQSIPPLDLTAQYAVIATDLNAAVLEVLQSGRYINGPVVDAFAAEFAQYIGTPECVVCNSGTDALYLALRALNIGPGDEVITSPFTFIATAETISAVGATPVFVDIEPDSFNLNPELIEAAISPRTRAIMPVHLFGRPADMTRIGAIATAHQLYVIEDCAQATGAEWGGQKVGSLGHVGCFSFFPTKNLGACGDGGALTTADADIAATARMLREHGSRERYYHEAIGINSRLDALQAAILRIKLRYLDHWNARRAAIAQDYQRLLAPIEQVIPPTAPASGQSAWNQYTVRLVEAATDASLRQRVRSQLQQQGVNTMIYYPVPLHQQQVYASLGYAPGSFPVAEQTARQVLSLPMFPELRPEQQARVVYSLKDALLQR